MKKSTILTAFFLIILFQSQGWGQELAGSRFGISFGIADNVHSADFTNLPGIPGCCAHFTSGDGSGFTFGILYEYPLSTFLFIGARLGYFDHSSTLTSTAGQALVWENGVNKNVTYNRTIDLIASSYGIEPRIEIRIIKGLIASAGLGIGFVSSAKFVQIDSTSEGTFADSSGKDTKSGVRNKIEGNLPNAASILLHGIFSLGYELPLGSMHSTFITPEITYAPAFTDLIKGLAWKTNAVIFALTMKFSL